MTPDVFVALAATLAVAWCGNQSTKGPVPIPGYTFLGPGRCVDASGKFSNLNPDPITPKP